MRRPSMRGRGWLAAACLVVAVGAGCTTSTDGSPAARASTTSPPSVAVTADSTETSTVAVPPCPTGSDELRCADVSSMEFTPVLRIVDGDTLHVEYEGRDESVRLYGVDAPERGAPCAADATRRLRELAGAAVRIRQDERNRDRYGRLLRYVYTPAGESIDATLVREGLAWAWRGDGLLEGGIRALEDDAMRSERGCLWRSM